MYNLDMCQIKHIIITDASSSVPGPRLLSFDMPVPEISQGSPFIVVQMDLSKVKGSLLWEAYSSLDSASLTTAVKVSKSCPNS